MKKLIKKTEKGFTLVELLVVVGILSILAVAALVAINPAEAQRKARDTQRIKDLGTLQTLLEQYISDNISSVTAQSAISTGGSTNQRKCDTTGWMGLPLCSYANTLPIDPANRTITFTNATGGNTTGLVAYQYILDANAQYRICTKLESRANAAKLRQDGVSNQYLEVFSSTSVANCTF